LLGTLLRAEPLPSNGACSVRLVSWNGELKDLFLDDGGTPLAVSAGEFSLGPDLTLRRLSASLRFFRELREADGTRRRVPVAEASLPEKTGRVIVILASAPAGSPLPLVARVLDASHEAHPASTIRVLNFSTQTLALRIGAKTNALDAGREEFFPFPDKGAPHVPVEVAVRAGEAWLMVSRGLRPTPAESRILCLVRDGRGTPDDPAPPVEALFLADRTPPPSEKVAQR
jgi:hypothetical protein